MSDGEKHRTDGSQLLGSRTREGRTRKIKLYDFRRPDKFSKEQIRTILEMHKDACRSLQPVLAGLIGEPVWVEVTMIDQYTLREVLDRSGPHDAFAVLDMRPLTGGAVMWLEAAPANTIVHRAAGGAGFPDAPDRTLTEIESLMLRDGLESMVPALNEGWRRIVPLDCRVTSIETDRMRGMIVPANEMVVTATYEISIGDRQWTLTLIVPYVTLEPIVSRLTARYFYRNAVRVSSGRSVGHRVGTLGVETEIAVDLGALDLSEIADVVEGRPLRIPDDARMVFRAGGVDVAVLERPASLLDLPDALAVTEASRTEHTARLLRGRPGGAAATEAARTERALSEVRRELRGIRQAMAELSDNRAAGEETEDGETRISAAQTRDVSLALAEETTQTLAFVLAPLDPVISAAVLAALPEEQQPAVVRRIAALGPADMRLHRRIVSHIARRSALSHRQRVPGGPETAASILNHAPRSVEKLVMERFQAEWPDLFELLASRMFEFEDFALVDPTAIRKLQDRIDPREMALALKGAGPHLTRHLLSSFGTGYAEHVRAAQAVAQPTRLRDVEAMQKEIIAELRALEQAGEVTIARPGEILE